MIKEMLEDHTGGTSTIRAVALIPTFIVSVGWLLIAIARAVVAIRTSQAVELPSISLELSGFCLGAAGLKVAQRIYGEVPQQENPPLPLPGPLPTETRGEARPPIVVGK